mmetsp:Transcript_25516/g.73288  ORF Transcript_25516/g.73288 Transcript_25516/m.73288 type:complete len:422 (-) Transcript_25516:46-1311(-)
MAAPRVMACGHYLPPEEVLGSLVSEADRAALEGAVARIAAAVGVPDSLRQPCHYMVYGHQADVKEGLGECGSSPQSSLSADCCGPPCTSSSIPQECMSSDQTAVSAVRLFSERLVERLQGSDSTTYSKIISIRVLFAPPHCEGQCFHLDYGQVFRAVDTVFVAMSAVSAGNCTEVLQWRFWDDAVAALEYARMLGKRVDGGDLYAHIAASRPAGLAADPSADVPLARILPLESKQWGIWVVPTSHCFHRRGPTVLAKGGPVRVTLNIDVAREVFDTTQGFCALGASMGPTFLGQESRLQPCHGDCSNRAERIGAAVVDTGNCRQCIDDCATGSTSKGSSSSEDEDKAPRRALPPDAPARRFEDSLGAFVCVDTLRSLQTGRICGQDMIDDLSEQDIYLCGELGRIVSGDRHEPLREGGVPA